MRSTAGNSKFHGDPAAEVYQRVSMGFSRRYIKIGIVFCLVGVLMISLTSDESIKLFLQVLVAPVLVTYFMGYGAYRLMSSYPFLNKDLFQSLKNQMTTGDLEDCKHRYLPDLYDLIVVAIGSVLFVLATYPEYYAVIFHATIFAYAMTSLLVRGSYVYQALLVALGGTWLVFFAMFEPFYMHVVLLILLAVSIMKLRYTFLQGVKTLKPSSSIEDYKTDWNEEIFEEKTEKAEKKMLTMAGAIVSAIFIYDLFSFTSLNAYILENQMFAILLIGLMSLQIFLQRIHQYREDKHYRYLRPRDEDNNRPFFVPDYDIIYRRPLMYLASFFFVALAFILFPEYHPFIFAGWILMLGFDVFIGPSPYEFHRSGNFRKVAKK